MNRHNQNNINNITGKYPYDRRKNTEFNLNEYQKQEIYRQGGDVAYQTAMSNSYSESDTSSSQPVGFLDTAVYLDTAYQTVPSNLANGEIVFDISSVNEGRDIPNIIELNISPFYFQIPIQSSTQPNFYFYRRVYLSIAGFPASQSVRANNGNFYQFEFEVININSLAIQLVPIRPSYYLQSILTALNEIRMRFSVGPDFTPIPLLKTTVLVQMTEGISPVFPNPPTGFGTNPITFTILNGDLTTLLYDMPQPFVFPFVPPAPGIAVYFKDFVLIPAINNTQGLFITRIISETVFEIAGFDASAIAIPPPIEVNNSRATMVIGKNRIAMSLRFTSVANKTTNYIVVSKS
jgi:hypothetical protein